MDDKQRNFLDEVRAIVGKPPENKKWCGFVVGRMASDRFPGKAILPLAGYPAWWHAMQRMEAAATLCGQKLEGAALITSKRYENDILEQQAHKYGYDCIRHNPEYDLPGRKLAALDRYGCDLAFQTDASQPLCVWENAPIQHDVAMRYNCWPSTVWRNNQPSGNPVRSAPYVVGNVGVAFRWDQLRNKHFATTPLEYESGTWVWRVPSRVSGGVATPRETYMRQPDWFFDYYRWYQLDLDTHADGVMMQVLYNMFWEGPGTVVDWRKCIDWLDDPENKDYHYNRISPESAVNQERDARNAAAQWQHFLGFCESYIRPEDAPAIYCAECGEYLGYVTKNHSVQRLHRPDNSVVTGHATIGCTNNHFRVWQHTLERTVSAGSAVLVPMDALEYSMEG